MSHENKKNTTDILLQIKEKTSRVFYSKAKEKISRIFYSKTKEKIPRVFYSKTKEKISRIFYSKKKEKLQYLSISALIILSIFLCFDSTFCEESYLIDHLNVYNGITEQTEFNAGDENYEVNKIAKLQFFYDNKYHLRKKIIFYQDGDIQKNYLYEKDSINRIKRSSNIGESIEYYDKNGKLTWTEFYYLNGLISQEYYNIWEKLYLSENLYPDGKIEKIFYNKKNKIGKKEYIDRNLTIIYFYEKNQLVQKTTIESDSIKTEEYFDDLGKLYKTEFLFADGNKEIKFYNLKRKVVYDEDKYSIGHFDENGFLELREIFFPSGQVQTEFFAEDSLIRKEIIFADSTKQIHYFKGGELIKIEDE
ncbi:MAG: hypothetical protein U9P79_10395 [Candidatus Cloacimonadota bacterium]|nr:hypothetical protein [Candidatus Cloacimonadota bacterium]